VLFLDLPRLRQALLNLPGEEAQYRMAPALRRQQIPDSWTRQGVRESAVFILLFPRDEQDVGSGGQGTIFNHTGGGRQGAGSGGQRAQENKPSQAQMLHTVLMQRPVYEGAHSGQISFPGGRLEPWDTDLQQTALREMEEEIGVASGSVEVLGPLSGLYVPVSHSHIQPFVGFVHQEPIFRPDPREVQDLLVTSISALFNDSAKDETEITVGNGIRLNAPYYAVHDRMVWGATAMIISELEALVKGLE